MQYVDAFEQVKDNFDDKTVTLIESLADYGHYMQLFLSDSKGWKIGVDHQEMKGFTASYDLDAAKEALSDYAVVRETGESDLEKITYSLYLDAETSVYVYLKPNADYTGNLTVTVDGSEAEAELQKDGRYRVAIRDISAHRLGDTHTILATTDSGLDNKDVRIQGIKVGVPVTVFPVEFEIAVFPDDSRCTTGHIRNERGFSAKNGREAFLKI